MESYIIVGTNKIHEFIMLMEEMRVSPRSLKTGVEEDTLKEINGMAIKKEIAIFAVSTSMLEEIGMMMENGMVDGEGFVPNDNGGMEINLNDREFVFRTMAEKKTFGSGVLVPIEKGISEEDIMELRNYLGLKMDVNTFLKQI